MGIHHLASGTRLLVKSSRARGEFRIVGARIALADEPGAWDVVGGKMMADALDTALGKPGSDLIADCACHGVLVERKPARRALVMGE